MKTTDLFKSNRSAKRLNESLEKTFGTKINFEDFDTTKLEDARNKLRTQIHDARSQSGFNETIENETLTKAQWMHDAIVAELMDREEHIVDTSVQEGGTFDTQEVVDVLKKFDENMNERGGYGDPDYDKILDALHNYDVESAIDEVWNAYSDQDGGEIDMYDAIKDLEDEFKFLVHSNPSQRVRSTQQSSSFGNKEGGDDFDDPDNPKNWGGDHNDQAAYDDRRKKEEVEMEGGREMTGTARDRFISTMTPRMDNDALMQKVAKVVNSPEFHEDTILKIVDAGNTVTHPVARYIQKKFEELQYDLGRSYEDYPERVAEKLLSMLIDRTKQGVAEGNDYSAVTNAITRRIIQQHPQVLAKYGPEVVGLAIDEIAEFVGNVDEIGSSDVSGWTSQVIRSLSRFSPLREQGMSRAAKGMMKYGKTSMKKLAQLGREGVPEEKMNDTRDQFDKYKKDDKSVTEMNAGSVAGVVNPTPKNKAKTGTLFGGTYKQKRAK